jgi:protein TonB
MTSPLRYEIQPRRRPAFGAVAISLLVHIVVIAAVLYPWSSNITTPLPAITVTVISANHTEKAATTPSPLVSQSPRRPDAVPRLVEEILALATKFDAPPIPPAKPKWKPVKILEIVATLPTETPQFASHESSKLSHRRSIAPSLHSGLTSVEPLPIPQVSREARDVAALTEKMATPDQPLAHGPILDATLIANLQPEYPILARRRGYQGRVVVVASVLSSGEVGFASLVTSSGYEMLDDAALAAVKAWRLLPARNDGEAVDGRIEIPFDFVLQ